MDDLFSWNAGSKARADDPVTSKDAAVNAGKFARKHHELILSYLHRIAPASATYEQIADATNLDRHAVGRRLKEIRIDGGAIITGIGKLKSGRSGQLWAAHGDKK